MTNSDITYKNALRQGKQILSEAGISINDPDAEILLEFVTKMSRATYYIKMNELMQADEYEAFLKCIEKRREHIPLQHITNSQVFMGIDFFVNENVLCPRQDTEVLVDRVNGLIDKYRGGRILDMCTGSGCILISILSEALSKGIVLEGTGVDISDKALEVARLNAKRILTENVKFEFVQSDLFSGVEGLYDIVISNPPYIEKAEIDNLSIEVKEHEPLLALDGGEDGLDFYRSIINEARKYLKQGGRLVFEIGYNQGKSVSDLLKNSGYKDVEVIKDLANLDRVVMASMS